MGSPAQNSRAFLERLFHKIALNGTHTALPPALSRDVIWTATNSSPLAGCYIGKEMYLTQVLSVLKEKLDSSVPSKMTLERIIVDETGEWASVQFRSEGATGKNGADFSMKYCWIIRVGQSEGEEDMGRIKEVIGFYDGVKMSHLFD